MTKKLGFGLMRLPLTDANDPASIDMAQLCEMVDTFLSRGFTYFDTAWMYCGGKSQEAIGKALVARHPRESFSIATKLPSYMVKCKDDRDKIFNIQLEATGAGYFDYYLLHNINTETLPAFNEHDCFAWLREKKAQGLAKKIGFSYHDGPELLDKLLCEHPEIEFVQLQINYLDWESAGVQSRKCYEVACRHGKQVIVMEPVKGGMLARVPEKAEKMFKEYDSEASVASWAIRFAAGLENVFMVLSGMSNMEQLCDNLSYMDDFKPLTSEETAMVHRAADIINSDITVPCTGCEYCVVKCPSNIPIPKYFSLYNTDIKEGRDNGWTSQMGYYDALKIDFGGPADCLECGACEDLCPQHLPIRKHLRSVKERFE